MIEAIASKLLVQNVSQYFILSFILLGIGLFGMMVRKNLITILMSLELALNSVNIAFVGIDRLNHLIDGEIFALFTIALAAAEAAVGLGIILSLFRLRKAENVNEIIDLKG
ncbi:MAG: NADH-quinone oxidoreductase subunit NuoK [Hydrogenobaculum sp.]